MENKILFNTFNEIVNRFQHSILWDLQSMIII